ncbi:MAG: molybdopterin molybdotransferase MoeA, partial [Planctomycetota bacterium]|nr:molybdopterin molybdotransferase MoeA [Planctomycetota bacterium]
MRGFAQRVTVEHAIAWIDSVLAEFRSLPTVELPLREAAGCVLATDVISPLNVPRFARSMMDGFAVRSEETYGATSYNPLSLRIIGTCLPGTPFPTTVNSGEAVRIMTGAPLPLGTDAVVPVEQTELSGDDVRVLGEVSAGKHVGQVGEDLRSGETVLASGRVLRPQDLGVLSSIGVGRVTVIRSPRVRIVITGNELLPAGTVPTGFQTADANGPM